jgi:hypothetical protein
VFYIGGVFGFDGLKEVFNDTNKKNKRKRYRNVPKNEGGSLNLRTKKRGEQ